MIRKILFPVDFSPSCAAMAAYIQRASFIFGAEVTIVHVCDLNTHNGFELVARPAVDIAADHFGLARSKLDVFLASEFPPAKSPRLLLTGDAATRIADTANKHKFDLIMMPTHAGRFRRFLLGSTTAKVLNDSECPVLTTEHAATAAPRSFGHRNWVCALKLSSGSERVLRYARDAAQAAGANLSVIHVIEDRHGKHGSEGLSEGEQKALEGMEELQKLLGSEASACVAFGRVKETLLDQIRRASADVLVIGRSFHSTLGRLEDLTYSLVRDSPCPVVSV
jgi:nucleotide-binding universal stress UspA family protein